MAQIVNLGEIVAAKVGHRELTENVVEDRRRLPNRVIAGNFARRLEPGEDEGVDELFQRHAILQADRDRDGEVVHQRPEGGTFLVHVDEDLAKLAIIELPGVQVDLVAAYGRLLDVPLAAIR